MSFQSSLLSKAENYKAIQNQTSNSISPYSISLMMMDQDSEPIIEVESDLRTIHIPDKLYNIGVTGDHLCETIYFKIPRYFDGVDLSTHDCIIRFFNAGHEYGEKDVCNTEIFDDYIKFGWCIDKRVTRYSGEIEFTIQFETIDEYQWQTIPAKLNILQGINVENVITDKDDSIFRSLSKQIDNIKEQLDSIQIETNKIPDIENEIKTLNDEVTYLKDNVVYSLNE